MRLVDLTRPHRHEPALCAEYESETIHLPVESPAVRYTGVVHRFRLGSMSGTYIDFPGHIREEDDGLDAETWPLEALYRVPARVIRLDREHGSGAVTAEELAAHAPAVPGARAIVLNVLGARSCFVDGTASRSVWLAPDAVRWIAAVRPVLLVSDIYEDPDVTVGAFSTFFRHRIATVCLPRDLHLVNAPRAFVTALPLRLPGAVQLPCRLLAELEDQP